MLRGAIKYQGVRILRFCSGTSKFVSVMVISRKQWKWAKRHSTVSINYHSLSLGGVLFLANVLKLIVTLQHDKTSCEEVHANIDRPYLM